MFDGRRIWLAYLVVFAASACSMAIELVAGRIMAPYIGVSLYTWTSIIGVVLAGMSLGNYLGGVVADRRADRATLGLVFTAGGLASLGILTTSSLVFAARSDVPLVPRIVLFTAAIFLPASLVLGMVSPIVVKLALADPRRAGFTVGSIYACSTVGSIVGTFATGFWLISWLGTRTVVWAVGLTLVTVGLVVGETWRPTRRLAGLAAVAAACAVAVGVNGGAELRWLGSSAASLPLMTTTILGGLAGFAILACLLTRTGGRRVSDLAIPALALVFLGWDVGLYRAPCQVESNYFCIQVDETIADGRSARALVLDHLVHSYVVLDDPTALGYGYERAYAELTRYHAAGRPGLDTLFVGGGGYAFPRYTEAVYPQASIDVVEIDPAVTRAARDYLGLSPDTRIRSFDDDARAFLLDWKDPKKYDVVYGDAFNDLSVPYHLTTVEFNRLVADRMKPDGIYLINVIDSFERGEFVRAFVRSLRQVFPHVYLFGRGPGFASFDRNTYVIMASRQPFDQARFDQLVGGAGVSGARALDDADLDAYLAGGRGIVLTDDFAPVDQLMAWLYVERNR